MGLRLLPVYHRQAGGYLDLEGGNRICMVLEWTLGLKRLAYSRIDLSLCCSVSLHLKGTWETQNHQTFCVSLVLVSFTLIYRAACPFLVKHSTIITSEESLRNSKLPVTGCLRTKGQDSQGHYGHKRFFVQNLWRLAKLYIFEKLTPSGI